MQVYDDQPAWVGSESAHIHLQRRQDEEDFVVDARLLHVMCLLLRHLAQFVEALQDSHGRQLGLGPELEDYGRRRCSRIRGKGRGMAP